MRMWMGVHWEEGMFLRPQHLQMLGRHWHTLLEASLGFAVPFPWGFSQLEIAEEELANGVFKIERCELLLPSGTLVRIPGNTKIDDVNFLDIFAGAELPLDVFFGVPVLRPNLANVGSPATEGGGRRYRYSVEELEFCDENTGAASELKTRCLQGRLFFGQQDREDYETVRIASLERTPGPTAAPRLVETAVPPLLSIRAWKRLQTRVEAIVARVEATGAGLARTANRSNMTISAGPLPHVDHLLKLHVLNETGEALNAFIQSRPHPYLVYTHLRAILGRLSVFDRAHRRPVVVNAQNQAAGVEPYVHDRCGPTFASLIDRIDVLLGLIGQAPPERADFQQHPTDEHLLVAQLQPRWIQQNLPMYVGLDSPEMDPDEIHNQIFTRMKIAAPSDAQWLHQTGAPGLPMREIRNPGPELESVSGRYYFRVERDGTFWPRAEQEGAVAMYMETLEDLKRLIDMKMAVYVVQTSA
ncbi:MAG: type VI secretion system baseplate subunit TssK [Planctomycetes bacterium]|nr:type VI secretion system baseplate subunit TssK [Planctomycetota bacterium]